MMRRYLELGKGKCVLGLVVQVYWFCGVDFREQVFSWTLQRIYHVFRESPVLMGYES